MIFRINYLKILINQHSCGQFSPGADIQSNGRIYHASNIGNYRKKGKGDAAGDGILPGSVAVLELAVVEGLVESSEAQELLVGALLDDVPVLQDEDDVGVHDG